MIDVGSARMPRMERHRPQVGRPGNRREMRHAQYVGVPAARERHLHGIEPVGGVLRDPLLVDLLAAHTFWKAL